jgi:proteasome lid subunit RPN8/RPN11
MKLEIPYMELQKINQHAEADYPNECCGFFYGQEQEGEIRRVQIVQPVKNAKEGDQSRRFQIDPNDYRKAEKYAIDHDLDLLGVYHSHPDHPAEPSERERKGAKPWFSYVFVSVQNGKATDSRSWRLNDERQFDEETILEKELSTS